MKPKTPYQKMRENREKEKARGHLEKLLGSPSCWHATSVNAEPIPVLRTWPDTPGFEYSQSE